MFLKLAQKIFGSANSRLIKKFWEIVVKINKFEPSITALSDESLKEKTAYFKDKLAGGLSLDDILPEAFAVVREAAKRVHKMRHFDVQLIGGIVLHKGMISEMRTGEGKTLVATLPAYLNSLAGKGVHVVTVNDYLAQRDSNWMAAIYNFLGVSVGCITSESGFNERKLAYDADITYGTSNEFGFDYLRDNLKYTVNELVQRHYHYAIIDEVDSILIDGARVPLIISGKAEKSSQIYLRIDKIVRGLTETDYEIDKKSNSVLLSDPGNEKLEQIFRQHGLIDKNSELYDSENISILHHVTQALRAHKLYTKDIEYLVHEGEVRIIDEFTGRTLEGRRYSDGLHQAIEAKEGVTIHNESQTIASLTLQNYFRMYSKLSGMTGTAMTEANEFHDIYKLEVVAIPTHMEIKRQDEEDVVYKSAAEKNQAIAAEIEKAHEKSQPVLVGTTSIAKSEELSHILHKKKIKHNVLNAKHHALEAEIIAQAGRPGAITIATNMAGRGTDIQLGGNAEMLATQAMQQRHKEHPENNPQLYHNLLQEMHRQVAIDRQEVLEMGGLLVIGTERHESRRIDNQLRGRSGRQGDPGRTIFFVSLQDDLMRIFGSDRISSILTTLGLKEGEAIVHPWVSRSLEKAQQKVEAHNYEIRKNLLQYDDVVNEQRNVIYNKRMQVMHNPQIIFDSVDYVVQNIVKNLLTAFIPLRAYREEWNLHNLENDLLRIFKLKLNLAEFLDEHKDFNDQNIREYIEKCIYDQVAEKRQFLQNPLILQALQQIFFMTIDLLWKDHLNALDNLRSGINLRAYGQKNPLSEYKFEAFNLFKIMLSELEETLVQRLFTLNFEHILKQMSVAEIGETANPDTKMNVIEDKQARDLAGTEKMLSTTASEFSIPANRNSNCPCGSGKKYKHCHGRL